MPSDHLSGVSSSDLPASPPLRMLVVCTANVCRSPVAERLLQRHLDQREVSARVRSAGTHGGHNVVHRDTVRAAADVEVDLGDHVSRPLSRELLDSDGADLVITMTREHLRHAIGINPDVWPRTFTLKEVVRRASAFDAVDASIDLPTWRLAVADGRTAASMMRDDPDDDVLDPYGGPSAGHAAMVAEVSALTDALARHVAAALR
jgi:protein-tyrosine phosphatase